MQRIGRARGLATVVLAVVMTAGAISGAGPCGWGSGSVTRAPLRSIGSPAGKTPEPPRSASDRTGKRTGSW